MIVTALAWFAVGLTATFATVGAVALWKNRRWRLDVPTKWGRVPRTWRPDASGRRQPPSHW